MNTLFWIIGVIIMVVVLGTIIMNFIDWYRKDKGVSFKQAIELTGLPIITLYIRKEKYNFLVDTGSSGCHIDSRYIPKDVKPYRSNKVMGMEGNFAEVNTYLLLFTLDGKEYSIECLGSNLTSAFTHVKEEYGVTLSGILGSDFFSAYDYIIDFKKYIFYTKKK